MDRPSLIVVVVPIVIPVALFAGIALPFAAASRPGFRRRAGRQARPPTPRAHDTEPAGYLYIPCARTDRSAGTRRWVQQVPIVKKTATLIYYTSDTWDRREAAVSPGCISREEFETDTRCRQTCPRNIAAGPVCAPHSRGHRHCTHVLAPGPHCHPPGGCGNDCPAQTPGRRCAQHGHTWEHCPHGQDPCQHGYPPGVIPVPGHRPGPAGPLFFATRQAAEDHLHRTEPHHARQAAPPAPPITELRRAMADAHPDRGGTTEQFIQAHHRYQTALRAARG